MNKFKCTLKIGGMFYLLLSLNMVSAQNIYVSPKGNDKAAGTVGAPLHSIEKALENAQKLPKNKRGNKPVQIFFREGVYTFDTTVYLSKNNSDIALQAYPGETVRFYGGVSIPLSKVQKINLPASAYHPEKEVYTINLRKAGITDYGKLRNVGFARPNGPAWGEIFINKQPMHLARWPNSNMIPMGKVLEKGSVPREDDFANIGGKIKYDSLRINTWAAEKDAWMAGYFMHGYADDMVKIKEIDTANKTLTTATATLYGYGNGQPWRQWYGINLLAELDTAGEYYIDKEKGILYFLPPERAVESVEFSVLETPFFILEGAKNITIKGITFEVSRGMGMAMANTQNITIEGCTFHNLGSLGISIGKGIAPFSEYRHEGIGVPQLGVLGSLQQHMYANTTFNREGGHDNKISSCQFYNLGAGGVSLGGGNRLTLERGNNIVENCVFHDINRIEKSYRPAVHLTGVGNKVRHCDIYNLPSMAILMHGNDHLVEYNYIHNVCLEIHDMGAFYYGRDPSELGTVLRYNYFENIPDKFHTSAVYHDDGAGGLTVTGNVFYHAGLWNGLLGGGSGNTYSNNIFIGTKFGLDVDNRLQNWSAPLLKPGGLFEKRLKAVNYQKPPFSTHYPGMATYFADSPAVPKNNLIEKNVFVDIQTLLAGKMEWLDYKNSNWETTHTNVDFADWENCNFSLGPKSKVYEKIPGFQEIPFHKIGLYENTDFPTIKKRNGLREAVSQKNQYLWEQVQAKRNAYTVTDKKILSILQQIKKDKTPVIYPNPHPGAQWFGNGNFGLFMHWGPHSTKGEQPSWAMIKHYSYGYKETYSNPENYFALAKDFDPKKWEPEKICKAAKEAGMSYAVLTAKHHDGFALWPSKYGNYNIGVYHPGRDLIKPYVEACRKNGLKVGFYFSQQDWHFPDYPLMDQNFNFRTRYKFPITEEAINNERYNQWLAYTIAQLKELLTSYGKIDVLWFDGFYWPGKEREHYTDAIINWIRTLQPSIVINDRWYKLRTPDTQKEEIGKGDFATVEWKEPEKGLQKWWEFTTSWSTSWGASPLRFDDKEALQKLVLARSLGGNFLINIGPSGDGVPPEGFYKYMKQLAAWIKPNKEALFGKDIKPASAHLSNMPATTDGQFLYLHIVPAAKEQQIKITTPLHVERIEVLKSGKQVSFKKESEGYVIDLKDLERSAYSVLKVQLKTL